MQGSAEFFAPLTRMVPISGIAPANYEFVHDCLPERDAAVTDSVNAQPVSRTISQYRVRFT